MGKKKRQQEIERDRQVLEEALRELTAGVSLPETLSAQALFARLASGEAQAGNKRRRGISRPAERQKAARLTPEHVLLSRKIGDWVRPFAAAAAVFFACAGTLLAYQRQGSSFSGAAINQAAPAPAAAAGAGEGAAYDLADAASPAAAAHQGEAEAARQAPGEEMAKKQAASPAGEGDGDTKEPFTQAPALEEALLMEEGLLPEVAQPTAAFGSGIAQVELRNGIAGGSSWQEGEYLYYLAAPAEGQGMSLYIMQAQDMQVMASISLRGQAEAQAVLVFGDRLALISNEVEAAGEEAAILRADIYDVADRSAPTLERTIRQDGVLAASALQEDRLCLVSTYLAADDEEEFEAPFTPHVRDSLSEGDGALTGEQLLVPAQATVPCWTVLTLLPLSGEASPASLAIFGGADSLLLDGDRGYLAASQYGETVQSQIFSLSLEGGIPRQMASATLQGSLLLPQALTPLPDGLLAAVQEERIQRFYRLDETFSEPAEVLLPALASGPEEAASSASSEEADPGQEEKTAPLSPSEEAAGGQKEEITSLHTETPEYNAQG